MMPFGLSMGGSGGGAALRRTSRQLDSQQLKRLTAAAAVATAGAAGVTCFNAHRHKLPVLPVRPSKEQQQHLLQIPRELAEVICGAVGEIVQVAVLYPLDTIKVRCQAGGLPVAAVVQQLLRSGATPGAVLRQLYAGVMSASLASVVVGSLYFASYCAAKRAATKLVASAERQPAQAAAAAATGGSTAAVDHTSGSNKSSSGSSSGGSSSIPHHFPHSMSVECHGFDPVFAAICSDERASAAAAKQKQQQGSTAATAAAGSTDTSSSSGSQQELSSNGKLQANILAACAAAMVGALVEAPVELFKHRAQAGQIQGAMLPHVMQVLKQSGPAALYGSFFVPFLFKSLPFDIGELMTYSSLNDWRNSHMASRGSSYHSSTSLAAATAAAAPLAGSSLSPAGVAPAVHGSSEQQQQQQQHMLALGSLSTASLAHSNSSSSGGGSGWSLLQPGQAVTQMPDHVWDMTVGAAAGAAAVLVSMPPDCIKTVMETGGGVTKCAQGRPLHSAAAFAATGRQLLKQHGPGGLFMGVAPRLIESVPSTMLYWLAVEGCRRLLEPYVAKENSSSIVPASS